MFTKYFGLFLMIFTIFGSLLFFGFSFAYDGFGIGIFYVPIATLILIIFFAGKHFYKIGNVGENLKNSKTNILTKTSLIFFVASLLMGIISYIIVHVVYDVCLEDCRNINNIIFVSTVIMLALAIILLIIHWLKNRNLK